MLAGLSIILQVLYLFFVNSYLILFFSLLTLLLTVKCRPIIQ